MFHGRDRYAFASITNLYFCRVICNPRGYVQLSEDAGFQPGLVYKLPVARQA